MSDISQLTALPLELAANDVHLFTAPTEAFSPVCLGELELLLSPEEQQRISRLRIAAKRNESLISRAMVRHILSHFLHAAPEDLVFSHNAQGKPFLKEQPIHFNVSHTAGLVLLAVSRDHVLGVDVESIHELPFEELAKRFFTSAEHAALLGIPESDRLGAFFRCWTRKESLLKATGMGITSGLNAFQVPLKESSSPIRVNDWMLHDVRVPSTHIASLAVADAPVELQYWSYRMGTVQPG